MDHALVKRLRGDVGDRLAQQRRQDSAASIAPMSPEDERQFARALISQALEEHARTEIMAGRRPLSGSESQMPRNLKNVVVGPATALEIRWTHP